MRFLYKQPDYGSIFSDFYIEKCCLKHITHKDSNSKRMHHHTYFEVHFLLDGCQAYELGGKEYNVKKGHFLIISPLCKHKISYSSPDILKISLNFAITSAGSSVALKDFIFDKTPVGILDRIDKILLERESSSALSARLTENCVFEMTASIMRLMGIKESAAQKIVPNENMRLFLAKQYIEDNIEQTPFVSEVAAFCHLSTKQLTRLFSGSDTTPAKYIQKKRLELAERLLRSTSLSLREISEKMSFSSEYYFNAFFKKHSGMSPGEYRRANK